MQEKIQKAKSTEEKRIEVLASNKKMK